MTSLENPEAPPDEPFVLLVDDHEACLHQLRELVEMMGYPCVSAPSSFDALICCDARTPRAVVTDLAMPEIDGEALARWLKPRYPDVPIVLVTGQDLDGEARRALEGTFAAILAKPIDVGQLLGLLARLLPAASRPLEPLEGRP
jgi:CheY-like chemotaxis protein